MAKSSSGKKYYLLKDDVPGYWKGLAGSTAVKGGIYQRSSSDKNVFVSDDYKSLSCKCIDTDFDELDQDDYELLRSISLKKDRHGLKYDSPSLYNDIKNAKIGDGVTVLVKEESKHCLRKGEIRYMGPLARCERRFFGIQLKGPFGDSDGTKNGDRYFECHESHGIFVTANYIKSVFQNKQGESRKRSHGEQGPSRDSEPQQKRKSLGPGPLVEGDTALKTNNDLTKNFTSHFSCPLCLDIVEEAVEADCCRKLFCEKCVKSLRECPLCRCCPFKTSPNHNSRQFIGNLITECPNESCPETPTRSNLAEHRQKCEFEKVCSSNEGTAKATK